MTPLEKEYMEIYDELPYIQVDNNKIYRREYVWFLESRIFNMLGGQ